MFGNGRRSPHSTLKKLVLITTIVMTTSIEGPVCYEKTTFEIISKQKLTAFASRRLFSKR